MCKQPLLVHAQVKQLKEVVEAFFEDAQNYCSVLKHSRELLLFFIYLDS